MAFREVLEKVERDPPQESLAARAETALRFYQDPNNFDPRVLGGLEIFEGRTSANLLSYPMAGLLYAGSSPGHMSFQIDGVVEPVRHENPFYQFLLAARELFAFDSFHIKQTRYPFGYLLHMTEVLDKTPFPRNQDRK